MTPIKQYLFVDEANNFSLLFLDYGCMIVLSDESTVDVPNNVELFAHGPTDPSKAPYLPVCENGDVVLLRRLKVRGFIFSSHETLLKYVFSCSMD